MKKNKKNTNNYIYNKIPYINAYQDEGIIETTPGRYTKMYQIKDVKPEIATVFDDTIYHQKINALLNAFGDNISIQFCIQNKLIPQDAYLPGIILNPNGASEIIGKYISDYNNIIIDNINIGHNNIQKLYYFVIATKAEVVDDAVDLFRQIDGTIRKVFGDVYGIEVAGLTLNARLKVMYTMYNPDCSGYGKIIDLNGDGNINLNDLKYAHCSTKDLIKPDSWDTKNENVDYTIINSNTSHQYYTRSFFINSISDDITNSLIADFTNISSNMIFSSIYEPLQENKCFGQIVDTINNNSVIKKIYKKDTLENRKKHVAVDKKDYKVINEDTYFDEAAFGLLKTTIAANDKVMMCTFAITIYADNIDDIEQETKLLTISAAKYNCTIKCLDYQQMQGFWTTLPLCTPRINTLRAISTHKLSEMSPLNVHDVVKQHGIFNGLNTVNDTLIMINRKNNINLNGLIVGSEHSGKTYQLKREIFNAMISTQDTVNIITQSDEYDEFVGNLGGKIITGTHVNLFEQTPNYGLTDDGNKFKSYFLAALVSYFSKNVEASEQEINDLLQNTNGMSETDIYSYISDNSEQYPNITNCIGYLVSDYITGPDVPRDNRLILYKIKKPEELCLVLDYLWNRSIDDKQIDHKTNWICIDPIDSMMAKVPQIEYMTEYMDYTNLIKNITTVIISESARLVNDVTSAVAIDEICKAVGYAKILNLGPIERDKYQKALNLPQIMMPYVSNAEPGKGIIITSSSNIPFDDSFLHGDNPIYQLCRKEIKQITF